MSERDRLAATLRHLRMQYRMARLLSEGCARRGIPIPDGLAKFCVGFAALRRTAKMIPKKKYIDNISPSL